MPLRDGGAACERNGGRQSAMRLWSADEEKIYAAPVFLPGVSAVRRADRDARRLARGLSMRTQMLVELDRRSKPLVLRGGAARTFRSLASFLALLFLLTGAYLLG